MKPEEPFFEYKRKLLSCDGDMQRMASVLLAAKSDLRINRYEYLGLNGTDAPTLQEVPQSTSRGIRQTVERRNSSQNGGA